MPEVKNWASILDDATRRQAEMLSRAPAVAWHVALMPDAHISKDAAVGSVIPTQLGTIIPAAVGSDIGCGVSAVLTNKTSHDLPDDLNPLIDLWTWSVPTGVTRKGSAQDERLAQAWSARAARWFSHNPPPNCNGLSLENGQLELGTLGSGNHFLEACLDEADRVWVVLHSGSRGVGRDIAEKYISIAQEENTDRLDHPSLAALQGESCELYIAVMEWPQDYAYTNRKFIMDAALTDLATLAPGLGVQTRIDCHHNFAARETHFGREIWVTRKGAIKAGPGELGIIPGSMGAATYVTSGLGNPDSYMSSAHGAGRQFSRRDAKELFSVESLVETMSDRAWNINNARGLLDEHPEAYKPIDQVMADQKDLTTTVHTLHQVANYKGA